MRGATLDAANMLGWTALLHACRYGHHAVVLSLLQNQVPGEYYGVRVALFIFALIGLLR